MSDSIVEYYFLVNSTKVRVLSWNQGLRKYLVELKNGVRQHVAEQYLKKTDEIIVKDGHE